MDALQEVGLVSVAAGFSELSKADQVKAIVRAVAEVAPELEDLPPEALAKVAQAVMAGDLRDEMKRRVKLEKIDYQSERAKFIERAGKTKSAHTRRAYSWALARLEAWCAAEHIAPLELTPALADDWIASEKGSSATVRLAVSGASAFWTYLERATNHKVINPFRGTKVRPPKDPLPKLAVPSDAEIRKLEAAAEPELRAAIIMMGQAGLRVGDLPLLSITGDTWTTVTKGKKPRSGKVPEEAREAIKRAGLPLRAPFASVGLAIRNRFYRLTLKLHSAGEIAARYSVHDLRHAFALRFYESTRIGGKGGDIYQVKEALGHANVAVTELYLRSLGAVKK